MFWNRTINVVDVHAEGEPGRVVVGGVLPPPGDSVFEMMCHMRDHDDWLRRFLLNEPRGAGITSANLVVPPRHPDAAGSLLPPKNFVLRRLRTKFYDDPKRIVKVEILNPLQ